jgi:hypothetical protein
MNRSTTFCNGTEIWSSKLFQGRLPQKAMEPTENTAPPFAVSKYNMSLRISGSGALVDRGRANPQNPASTYGLLALALKTRESARPVPISP